MKSSGQGNCRKLCLLLLKIAWSLLGFVAGLVVGTIAIKSGYWGEGDGDGDQIKETGGDVPFGVGDADNEGGYTSVKQTNCIVQKESTDVTEDNCSWCSKTR